MSFLKDYLTFTKGNEAPVNYHFWSALGAMSAIVSRRVWIDMGIFTIYPNLYIVLLGEPGNGKTTAMRIAKNLVRELPEVPFSGEAQTKESLVRYMRDNCPKSFQWGDKPIPYTPITIFLTELSHFFGPNSGHMIDFLTTIYDENKYEARTKNKGDDIIEGPYVTMLACTTQEWITTYLKSDIIGGGFTRRVIFVNEPSGDDKSRRVAFPQILPEQREALQACIAYARRLLDIKGPMLWTPDARAFYKDWYDNRDIPNDPDVRGYYRTRHVQILKVASLLSLAESLDMQLTTEHIQDAMRLLENTETTLTKVFQGIGRNELHQIATKALEYISRAPKQNVKLQGKDHELPTMLVKTLKGFMFRDAPGRDCADILDHLIQTEKVYVWTETRDQVVRQFVSLR